MDNDNPATLASLLFNRRNTLDKTIEELCSAGHQNGQYLSVDKMRDYEAGTLEQISMSTARKLIRIYDLPDDALDEFIASNNRPKNRGPRP